MIKYTLKEMNDNAALHIYVGSALCFIACALMLIIIYLAKLESFTEVMVSLTPAMLFGMMMYIFAFEASRRMREGMSNGKK